MLQVSIEGSFAESQLEVSASAPVLSSVAIVGRSSQGPTSLLP